MKIGILSMQNVINYGSYLQSYALKSVLETMGHEVFFVKIRPGKQIVHASSINTGNSAKIDKYILKRIEHVIFAWKRRNSFEKEYFHRIGIDDPINEAECDMIVIGSDEVFNCVQASSWGFTTQLFGDTAVPALSYAASCGYTTFERVEELGVSNELSSSLKKLKAISVRDGNTFEFVKHLVGSESIQHLDPVLIYDWKKEVLSQTRFKNYILVYAYDNRINSETEIKAIKAFAKKYNKQLISFGVYQRWCDKNIMCTPFELLSYFDSADYVITDTFHGTVISIKRNKQFATIVRDSNSNKLCDLLSRFDLEERQVASIMALEDIITKAIDYDPINTLLKAEKERSIDYLHSNLV